jgi:segregation and condensation protein B
LPGLAELKGAGLLDAAIPPGLQSPDPDDRPDLAEDEDPLDELGDEDEPDGR